MKKNIIIIALIVTNIAAISYAAIQHKKAERFQQVVELKEQAEEKTHQVATKLEAEAKQLQALAEKKLATEAKEEATSTQ